MCSIIRISWSLFKQNPSRIVFAHYPHFDLHVHTSTSNRQLIRWFICLDLYMSCAHSMEKNVIYNLMKNTLFLHCLVFRMSLLIAFTVSYCCAWLSWLNHLDQFLIYSVNASQYFHQNQNEPRIAISSELECATDGAKSYQCQILVLIIVNENHIL